MSRRSLLLTPSRRINTTFEDYVLALAPSGYWPLADGAGKLMELAGNRPATVTGSPTYGVTGHKGRAMTWSGSGQFASAPRAVPLPTSSITVVAAFKTSNATAAIRTMFARTGSSQNSWALRLGSNHKLLMSLFQADGTSHCAAQSSGTVNDGNWHIAVGTFDGTTAKIYLDGSLVGSSAALTGSWYKASTGNIVIGAQTTTPGNLYPGDMQHSIVLADQVLDATAVTNLNTAFNA